jgi:hypothetical protein
LRLKRVVLLGITRYLLKRAAGLRASEKPLSGLVSKPALLTSGFTIYDTPSTPICAKLGCPRQLL